MIAAVFDRTSATYDRVGVDYFEIFGRQLVATARLAPGERVLDIGCGRGAVLFSAADAVGAQGQVTGIDLSPGMVQATASEVEDRGLNHVDVHVMDAQRPTLPTASYDVVLAGLVIFFLPDPVAAVSYWRTLLRPGGRLGITTFDGIDARWSWVAEMQERWSPDYKPIRPAGMSRYESDDAVHALLAEGGFSDARSITQVHDIVFADADRWITWTWSQTQRAFWERLDDHARRSATADARQHLGTIAEPDGSIPMRQPVRYTTAKA
jgi:ubiquinone/menaquinone biosynthesis C-methylase UbiE